MSNFSKNLERLLAQRNLRKGELAERLGVAFSTVSRWFSGSEPTMDRVEQVANELRVSVSELLNPTAELRVGEDGRPYPTIKASQPDAKQRTSQVRAVERRQAAIDAGLPSKVDEVRDEVVALLSQFPTISRRDRQTFRTMIDRRLNDFESWCDDLDSKLAQHE